MFSTLLNKLGAKYALIQAPMLGVTSPSMVASIAKMGAIGSLPVCGMNHEATRALIRQTKQLTDSPFIVNTFVYDIPPFSNALATKSNEMNGSIGDIINESPNSSPLITKLPFNPSSLNTFSYRSQIPIFIEEKVAVVSFTFGCMTKDEINLLHDHNILCIGTATNIAEALHMKEMGVDGLVVQGYEAGGHKGSFLSTDNTGDIISSKEGIGLFSLLPQVSDAVNSHAEVKNHKHIPIIAAGGVYDARTVNAALLLGADVVQMGSCFLLSRESMVSEANRRRIMDAKDTDLVYMTSYTGRTARGVQTDFNKQMVLAEKQQRVSLLPYPYQNLITGLFRSDPKHAKHTNAWCGQSGGKYGSSSMYNGMGCADIMQRIIDEVNNSKAK